MFELLVGPDGCERAELFTRTSIFICDITERDFAVLLILKAKKIHSASAQSQIIFSNSLFVFFK